MARSQPQLGGMQQGYAGYDQSGAYGGYGQQQYTQYGQPANAPQGQLLCDSRSLGLQNGGNSSKGPTTSLASVSNVRSKERISSPPIERPSSFSVRQNGHSGPIFARRKPPFLQTQTRGGD
eukprot:1181426-Prorocentrum_minimum.AAC.5